MNAIEYKERKDAKKCVVCQKDNDTDGVLCSVCRDKRNEYMRDTVKWCRDNGICPKCRKNELFRNEKTCIECRAYDLNYKLTRYHTDEEWREKHYKQTREYIKKRNAERRANHLCVSCGKDLKQDTHKYCQLCRNKINASHRRKYIEHNPKTREQKIAERTQQGLCLWCDNKASEGKKLCAEHCKMLSDRAKQRRRKRDDNSVK